MTVRGGRVADDAGSVEALVSAATDGDEDAFRLLDRRIRGPARNQLFKRLGVDGATLDELSQEAVSEALQALVTRRFDPDRAAFTTFAYAVTHRVGLRYRRKVSRAREQATLVTQEDGGDDLFSRVFGHDQESGPMDLSPLEQIEAMRDCLRVEGVSHALSAEERYAVIGRAYGNTFEAIASRLGRSLDTVYRRSKRAIEKLRACMRAKGHFEE